MSPDPSITRTCGESKPLNRGQTPPFTYQFLFTQNKQILQVSCVLFTIYGVITWEGRRSAYWGVRVERVKKNRWKDEEGNWGEKEWVCEWWGRSQVREVGTTGKWSFTYITYIQCSLQHGVFLFSALHYKIPYPRHVSIHHPLTPRWQGDVVLLMIRVISFLYPLTLLTIPWIPLPPPTQVPRWMVLKFHSNIEVLGFICVLPWGRNTPNLTLWTRDLATSPVKK